MSGTRPKPEPLLEESQPRRPADRPVPPFQVLRAATENTRMMNATLDEMIARKRWVFATMALAFCISAIWYWVDPPLYGSAVSFYVLPSSVPEKEVPIYLSVRTDPQALPLIATSSHMFDHLIEVFDLGSHYGVSAKSADQRTILHGIIGQRVTVDLHEEDVIAVRVRDHDRAMAAAMANEVFVTTRAMVRAEQKADLERQLKVIQHVIDSTDRFATTRSTELIRLADELRSARGSGEDPARSEQALMAAANHVAMSNQDLMHQRRNYANLLAMMTDQEGDMIRLRAGAMEDIDTDPFWKAVQETLLITLASGLAAIVLLMLIIENWFAPWPKPNTVRR